MGGNAFNTSSPLLSTPRMPPKIYNLVLQRTLTLLRQHFAQAASPIESPGKPDYGDIDICLSSPRSAPYDPARTPKAQVVETLARDLGAKAWIPGLKSQPMNLAIPWPSDAPHASPQDEVGESAKGELYIQVDVHIFPSEKELRWHLFHAAHGDLWNILGSTIRRFGLTVNDRGLFLRIPCIEAADRKKALVFLTNDANAILAFLGLESERWWRPFENQAEMFEYAASCRLFSIKVAPEEGEMEGDVLVHVERGDGNGGQVGGEEGKKKLKHNDRQRMGKRPVFRAWMEDFIPKCRAEGRFVAVEASREEIQEEALVRFGVREEFELREREWRMEKHRDEMWRVVIKGSVPEAMGPAARAATCRYLKGVLMDGDILWHGEVSVFHPFRPPFTSEIIPSPFETLLHFRPHFSQSRLPKLPPETKTTSGTSAPSEHGSLPVYPKSRRSARNGRLSARSRACAPKPRSVTRASEKPTSEKPRT